jgi:hypothetical protein
MIEECGIELWSEVSTKSQAANNKQIPMTKTQKFQTKSFGSPQPLPLSAGERGKVRGNSKYCINLVV